jgi:hypothetical protein
VPEVVRELIVQRAAEHIRDAGLFGPGKLGPHLKELRQLAAEAGLEGDPLVDGGLGALERTLRGLETGHKASRVEASALSRGIYHRDVTSGPVMAAYKKSATSLYSSRLKERMPASPPPKPGKPGKDDN